MTVEEKLDKVLKALNSNADEVFLYTFINELSITDNEKEITQLAGNLRNDGFLQNFDSSGRYVTISVSGSQFIKNGGYISQKRREKLIKILNIVWKVGVAIIGVAGGILAVIQILELCNCPKS